MTLSELLAKKKTVLLDGAMGTELANQGVDIGLPLWSANALVKAPQIVRRIHGEYLRAGADVITTNTFRSNKRIMEKTGLADKWEILNRVSVELAFEARERYPIYRPILIAGSIAPVEDCYSPKLVPDENELYDEHKVQVELIGQLGVDFILAETIMTVKEGIAVAQACSESSKEFALSFFCKDETHLLSGESIIEAVSAVECYNPTALLVNCSAYQSIHKSLSILSKATASPVGCYANTGDPLHDGETTSDTESALVFAKTALSWVDQGARIIGGCCGTTPDHIYAIFRELSLRKKEENNS